uniref:cyclase family protein n=1 Tax=Nonomuraea pusilla TaxID=46177 RepID=UPI0006E2792C|nr:cyclase family protein [Nonomuraea pusilla]
MTDHRASFDASITFSNGGDLTVHGFRVDVPGPHVTEDEIAALFVASLGLLMTDAVELSHVRVFPEPHKGTRGGPSDASAAPPAVPGGAGALVDLAGEAAPGEEPGPWLEARDPAGPALARVAELPAVLVRVAGAERRTIDVGALAAFEVRGAAVLLHTGARDGHRLTPAAAAWLVAAGAALVGTDADRLDAEPRDVLLDGGLAVAERLSGLEGLPPSGALFTAAPPRGAAGRVPVRAYARVPA